MATEEAKGSASYTVTVGMPDSTIADIQAAAKKVKAPDNAKVGVTNGYATINNEEYFPYSATFSWSESI